MTDLAYCYNHMTDDIIGALDELSDIEHVLEIRDDDLEIPVHAIPPNPDDCEALPSQVHPSYPYGDPTNVNHPAAKPHMDGDPASRALFVDKMYMGCVTETLLWNDLALDHLLPIDDEKADAETAALARQTAVGTIPTQNPREDDAEEEEHEEGESEG